jgi:hypothetical protein
LPKVAPIIVSALPIPNNLSAEKLVVYTQQILHGLLDRHIKVVSYACDGTETERAVQRLLVEKADSKVSFKVKNPRSGCPDTEVEVACIRGNPVVMIQDSKHGLKTFRNNLFSGARLLTLGNYTAIYQRIREMAFEEGSPLYHRDVEKLDRQDDNAAARLFSAATLEFLSKNHADYLGEIVYLFVFGELVDAYQNRSMWHIERIKLVLRARYFLDLWQAFLNRTQYSEMKYFLSREATDIARMLIDGILGLVVAYRDHVDGSFPLLPWLHSSEPCEHVFGESRQIIKDFCMLDFFYMITKLRISLREAVLRSKTCSPKARASGYSHTYLNNKGINLVALATFPSDDDIQAVAEEAAEEAESLFALSGVVPSQLQGSDAVQLPSISTWLDSDGIVEDDDIGMDTESDNEDSDNEACELQDLLDQEEASHDSRTWKTEDRLMNLTCAALAVTADDMMRVYVHILSLRLAVFSFLVVSVMAYPMSMTMLPKRCLLRNINKSMIACP